jgi:Protein of unknown function (DUF2911)
MENAQMVPKALLAILISCGFAMPVAAQKDSIPAVFATPSAFASVEVHFSARRGHGAAGKAWWPNEAALAGPSRFAITYGQPYARGRQVEGELIPHDSVWRLGANLATILHTDVDLVVDTLRIPHGEYTLFLQESRGNWRLIVNRETTQWGLDYTPSENMGVIRMSARSLPEPEDGLSIFLIPNAVKPETQVGELRGVIRIKWGRTELSAPWRVDEQ